jgi:uncharacterized low-complexity protein
MSAGRLLMAVATALLVVSVSLASAQHAPAAPHAPADKGHGEAKPAESKAVETKTVETKAAATKPAETKPKSAAPATNPATAVEQILRKLRSQDLAKTKTPGSSPHSHAAVSHAAPAPRLQLAWRISLTWPDALTASKP